MVLTLHTQQISLKKTKLKYLFIYDIDECWLMREILIDWRYELKFRGYKVGSKRLKRIQAWFNHFK